MSDEIAMQVINAKQQLLTLQQSQIDAMFYLLHGNSISNSNGTTGMSMLTSKDLLVTINPKALFSEKKANTENNFARVLVFGDIITFVLLDGKVEMKPIACLEANEKQLFDSMKLAMKQDGKTFQKALAQEQDKLEKRRGTRKQSETKLMETVSEQEELKKIKDLQWQEEMREIQMQRQREQETIKKQ